MRKMNLFDIGEKGTDAKAVNTGFGYTTISMKCPKCGQEIRKDRSPKTCGYCGAKLRWPTKV